MDFKLNFAERLCASFYVLAFLGGIYLLLAGFINFADAMCYFYGGAMFIMFGMGVSSQNDWPIGRLSVGLSLLLYSCLFLIGVSFWIQPLIVWFLLTALLIIQAYFSGEDLDLKAVFKNGFIISAVVYMVWVVIKLALEPLFMMIL